MGSEAVWSESFDYDEATFYRYFAVHMGPHAGRMAGDLASNGGAYLLIALPFLVPMGATLSRARVATPADLVGFLASDRVAAAAMAIGALELLAALLCAVGVARALRGAHPDPSSPAWRARARLSLAWVASGRGGSPYDPAIEEHPWWAGVLALRAGRERWHDRYLVPARVAPPGGDGPAAGSVPLSAAVCADGVRRGPSGELVPWSEVHDLLEDGDPGGVAVLRSERLGETLLLKGGFGAPWGEVRAYIEGAIRRSRPRRRIGGAIRRAGEVLSGRRSIGE
ncbi:hypothetical protein [Olsenella profusa]|uniref:Uncharacterized protein n=1 Tax=Olsenella profusa F0195 TaxID=1125712 RepID=U2UST9_9ACTN|nr:hypothetical protein [Olsenella profusa]ERL06182.1 hypothetical protein HMPREF1316_0642 [Olsenella profusa F0195]